MKTYFTGCLHLNHERILSLCQRQFSTIKDHDEHIIEKINETVNKNDRLYIHGDFTLSDKWQVVKYYREIINCDDVRLLFGNHDNCSHSQYRRIFQQADSILEFRWGSTTEEMAVLSHYPFLCWNKSFAGSYMLFSHVHGKITPWINHYMPHYRGLDVGVDSAKHFLGEYRPFSLDEALGILGGRKGNSPDRLSCRVTSCSTKTFQYPDDHIWAPGQLYQRYFVTTDYNWGDYMDNFNHGGREKSLFVEYPDGKVEDILMYFNTFEKDECFGFVSSNKIPVGSIVFWGDNI